MYKSIVSSPLLYLEYNKELWQEISGEQLKAKAYKAALVLMFNLDCLA